MMKPFTVIVSLCSVVLVLFTMPLAVRAEEKVLNIFNWADWIDPGILEEFEQRFDVTVNYDVFDNFGAMVAALQTGATEYDVVFPDSNNVTILSRLGLLEQLDKENIPNLSNLDPRFLNQPFDPENTYSVPYNMVVFGLLYRGDKISEPVESWTILSDQQYADRIVVIDTMREVVGIALKTLGYSANTIDPDELQEAKNLLIQQKSLVKSYMGYSLSQFDFFLTSGEAWIIYPFFLGDVLRLSPQLSNIQFVFPQEGATKAVDALVIPKTAPHKDLAHQFINFFLEPEISARNNNYLMTVPLNTAAIPYIDSTLRDFIDNFSYIDAFEHAEYVEDIGDHIRLYDRIWSEVMSY